MSAKLLDPRSCNLQALSNLFPNETVLNLSSSDSPCIYTSSNVQEALAAD